MIHCGRNDPPIIATADRRYPIPAHDDRPRLPEIVAHRGDAEHFPENTLPALAAALRLGLHYVEFDVQLSADGVPYVIHDTELSRTTSASGDLRLLGSDWLDRVDAGEPRRFGHRYAGTALPRLTAVAELLAAHPRARAFVELKRASLEHHGRETCIERVLAALSGHGERCILISFDEPACRLARAMSGRPVGWVLEHTPDTQLGNLQDLGPEFVFCDHRRLPPAGPLPAGPWTWAVYEVRDATVARSLHARGVALIETMAPARLLAELGGGAPESP